MLFLCRTAVHAEPLVSPTWGFALDLPEGYAFSGGDGRDRFSFIADFDEPLHFDLVAYKPGRYASVAELATDVAKRLLSEGDASPFMYRGKEAVLLELSFVSPSGPAEGWAICVELPVIGADAGKAPGTKSGHLVALAYGVAGTEGYDKFHLSALDSLAPAPADRNEPGPITAFAYPGEGKIQIPVAGLRETAFIDASDKEAAKYLVDREFSVLRGYAGTEVWQDAWRRFYRAVRRDAFPRLAGIAFAVERELSSGPRSAEGAARGAPSGSVSADREFAEGVLGWTQSFAYERDLLGSDFVDLVSAATEGRGDCDSRALLAAILLQRANIDAAIMVSKEYGHAMLLADLDGEGARFTFENRKWMVGETTAKVPFGMIGKNVADPMKWLGILFE
ncbi:MAG TPA: hypothetical protein DIC34_21270 [Treponema sp.]|nr:hypothetical protein [Treponema sp.]